MTLLRLHSLTATALILLDVYSVSSVSVTVNPEPWIVESFTLEELQTGRSDANLAETLQTTGLLTVSMNNDIDNVASSLQNTICNCWKKDEFLRSVPGTDTMLLRDEQTLRSTYATATMGKHRPIALSESLDTICGDNTVDHMEALRRDVAVASAAFVTALDRLLSASKQREPLLRNRHGGIYYSVESIVQASTNLEHFHLYDKKELKRAESGKNYEEDILSLHTDAGLFLVFIPALSCGTDKENSFYLRPSRLSDTIQPALFAPGSISIMLGAGAEYWLSQNILSLKATQHTVRMRPGQARVWYGMSTYAHVSNGEQPCMFTHHECCGTG